jgi:hypothetical protein
MIRQRSGAAMERDIGFEPTTFSLGRATPEGAARGAPSQVLANPHKLSGGPVQGTQGTRQNPKGFVTRLLPGERTTLRSADGSRLRRPACRASVP